MSRSQSLALAVLRWQRPILAVSSLLALAGLDLVGAVLAKHWNDHRSLVSMLGGMGVFALLFWVYGRSLAYGELATVTISWVVMLQVGVLLLDRFHNGVHLPSGKWIAIAVILGLQAYLLLAPNAAGRA
jgi:predicted RND superfamily exporter protein